jgi:trans-aconitate methyltransferase
MSKIEIEAPAGKYSQLIVTLESGRVMAVILPDSLDAKEAAQVVRELAEIQDIVSGWQSN